MMTINRSWTWMMAAVALVSAAACGGDAPAAEGEDEIPAVVVTQWNDSTELFLEYPHLLAGQQTGNWAIHLSSMKDFKPITAGTLTVRFLRNGQEAKAFTIPAPARNGIYLLDPEIPEAGTYEVRLALRSPQVSSEHVLPQVRVFASRGQVPAEAEEAGGISYLKEQQWVTDFAVQPAAEREVARTINVPGELGARDGAQVQVSAPSSGIAAAEANAGAPSVGAFVRAGQVLAVLSPTSEEGGYARIRENQERLAREAARARRLYEAGSIPRKRLEEAEHELSVARAEARAMGGGPDADYRYRVRAPISGFVTARSFVPGGRVAAGEPLFTVIDPGTLWLRVQVPAAEASRLASGARAAFTLEGDPQTRTAEASRLASGARAAFTLEGDPQTRTTGSLVSVGTTVDPQTRTVAATFAVPNPDGTLRVGQFARVSVPVGGTVRGVAIPTAAIIDDGGTPVAYVQASGETFERRALRLGENDGTVTEVLEGIKPGEMVVTVGAYQVRLASLSSTPMSGGHAH
jgi:membrane fusion protein, heavy metal efflux system